MQIFLYLIINFFTSVCIATLSVCRHSDFSSTERTATLFYRNGCGLRCSELIWRKFVVNYGVETVTARTACKGKDAKYDAYHHGVFHHRHKAEVYGGYHEKGTKSNRDGSGEKSAGNHCSADYHHERHTGKKCLRHAVKCMVRKQDAEAHQDGSDNDSESPDPA